MNNEVLDEREFELINIVGADLGSNQRELSRLLDLSLGQTNMLIKRLVTKGYIRITQLNKRKVKYLLTPQGFAEKMRKSIKYTIKTMHSLILIKDRLKVKVIDKLSAQGVRRFVVLGRSDFALLIKMLFMELKLKDHMVVYVDEMPQQKVDGYLLICEEDVDLGAYLYENVMDVVHELAEDGELVNNFLEKHK